MVVTKSVVQDHLTNSPGHSIWTGLQGAWFFDDGAGTTAADTSGNGRNATISKNGLGNYTWDTTSGMEHLSIAWTDGSGGPTIDEVRATLASSLSLGDPDGTLLLVLTDNVDRSGTAITKYTLSQLLRNDVFGAFPSGAGGANWLGHPDHYSTDKVMTDRTVASYTFRHDNLEVEAFKAGVLDESYTLDALDPASDNLFSLGFEEFIGGGNDVDMDVYLIMAWTRVLTDQEITDIEVALGGGNPWTTDSGNFLLLF